jgi:hypothetical protein
MGNEFPKLANSHLPANYENDFPKPPAILAAGWAKTANHSRLQCALADNPWQIVAHFLPSERVQKKTGVVSRT